MIVLFRCDGNPKIGMGHAIRSFALAQALASKGHQVKLAYNSFPEEFLNHWRSIGAEVFELTSPNEAEELKNLSDKLKAEWIVLDGYAFDKRYHLEVKAAKAKLMLIVDHIEDHFIADLVLNQNPGVSARNNDSQIKLLLGEKYTLLRREFRELSRMQNQKNSSSAVISMGGSDVKNFTPVIVDILQREVPELFLNVIIGPVNQHKNELLKKVSNGLWNKEKIRVWISPSNMAEILISNDFAIFAAGSTSWELAALGVPGLCFILADNQEYVAKMLDQNGCAINLGPYEKFDAKNLVKAVKELISEKAKHQQMENAGRKLIDGQGVFRVIKELENAAV